jgi:hypothetical protein
VSSSLVFAVSKNRQKVFLSAFAEPVGASGARVFYFEQEGGGVEIAAAGESARTKPAVRLARAHRPGRYRVYAAVADRILGPEELQAGGGRVLAKARVEVVIVE